MRYGGFVLNNLFFAVFDEIITVKKSRRIRVLRDFLILSGERGIRTTGSSHFNGFQDRRDRPLCHLSKSDANIDGILILSKEWCFF